MKNIIISSNNNNNNNKIISPSPSLTNKKQLEETIEYFNLLIQKTLLAIQKYKKLDIIGANELNTVTQNLENLYIELSNNLILLKNKQNTNKVKNNLEIIRTDLYSIFKSYGTENIRDLLNIVYGDEYINSMDWDVNKYQLIESYVHPINFKVMSWKTDRKNYSDKLLEKNKIIEDFIIVEKSNNLDCYDLSRTCSTFQTKVYGIKIAFHNEKEKKTIIVAGLVDEILITCINNDYLNNLIESIIKKSNYIDDYNQKSFERYIQSLTLKEFIIYSLDEINNKYEGYMNQVKLIKKKTIPQVVNEFINNDLFGQRNTLIQLLLKSDDHEYQYLAYLLYDLLSNDNNGTIDTTEQTLLFDSLPWKIKSYFKEAMKQTISYTNNLSNFDNSKIPLEQQICLMKVSDSIKEKAMNRLKEVKSKTDDTGSKARTYLEGLLKIPFGIYKQEPILNTISHVREMFKLIIDKIKILDKNFIIEKSHYTNIEIKNKCQQIKDKYINNISNSVIETLINTYTPDKRNDLIVNICNINNIIKQNKIKYHKLTHSGKKIEYMKSQIIDFLNKIKNNEKIVNDLLNNKNIQNGNIIQSLKKEIELIENKWKDINNYMNQVREILTSAVHGHEKAKTQIERILAQWINGEQTGYSFGFEGPPGVGKCLAKDTPIMLSNGKIKMVQDITLKDKLMGDDGFERNVLALGSGREKMYRIKQVNGDDYVVNESHILSLKMSKAGRKGDKHQTILGKRYYKDDIVDICIKDYLGLPKYLKECLKGYKVGLNFREQAVSLDPYAIGYWLGGGNKNTFRITTIENEVVEYFTKYAVENGLQLIRGKEGSKNDITYHITTGIKGGNNNKRNPFLNSLKQYNLINNKHIPEEYKLTTRENRLSLLAGLIDSTGYYNPKNNSLEITQKNKVLADDIVFLVRSLGMIAMIKECEKSCTYKGEKKCGIYYRITISGSGLDEIPVLLERKKGRSNNQIKNCLNTGIEVVPLEEDKYYGFQIDGNSRFLLGDFTVTHNTSFAKKGLANCLKDENGECRPFSFIAIGGQDNGSTLNGHNYTYVGSEWGKFVDILIKHKCMNPIIFIDELDKVSKTEHGKEIIGILTHLIDPTQNDVFQDKYFNGIDLDLSKALFIFSYNDVSAIDKILLDRIHRIKFEHLSLEDKIVITRKHVLPEIYKNMGLEGCIEISDENIIYIVENYTNEPGIRKFKELLFDIIGEINLSCLKSFELTQLPIKITNEDIKYKYLKNCHENLIKKIPLQSQVGVINGLWANSMGQGGIIPIEVKFFPSASFFDLKLTGLQGDVMKESMTVAKTLATSLVDKEKIISIIKNCEESKLQGIHIHCPEGSVPKDGPSAGTAITSAIYSLLSGRKIKNTVAITGEINLQGCITAIGGLDLKILGGLKGGVKEFIYPKENAKDYKDFVEKYKDKNMLDNIKFHEVENISQVLNIILEV